jgi:hypothetical protein
MAFMHNYFMRMAQQNGQNLAPVANNVSRQTLTGNESKAVVDRVQQVLTSPELRNEARALLAEMKSNNAPRPGS